MKIKLLDSDKHLITVFECAEGEWREAPKPLSRKQQRRMDNILADAVEEPEAIGPHLLPTPDYVWVPSLIEYEDGQPVRLVVPNLLTLQWAKVTSVFDKLTAAFGKEREMHPLTVDQLRDYAQRSGSIK